MSEFVKLKEKYQILSQSMNIYFKATFDSEVKELQENCKHDKTHWMQELTKEGDYKEGLFKRCFICGATLEKLDTGRPEFIDELCNQFDLNVENRKQAQSLCVDSTSKEKTT